MTGHLSEAQLVDLLRGEPDAGDGPPAREHLRACATCAAALEREAALDHRLWLARTALAPCPGCGAFDRDDDPTRCEACGAARRVRDYAITAVRASGDRGRVYAATAPGGGRVAIKEVEL